jgi:hypothetical protein
MSAGKMVMVALGLAFAPMGARTAFAGADTEPVIVVPGRPGVPVMIDGQDVSGAVIEGDWGLARSRIGLTIIKPRPLYPWRDPPGVAWGPPVGRYFPATGHPPRIGRLEVIPPADRPLPPPAESFRRGWQTQSAPLPPTVYAPYDAPMLGPLRSGGRHGPRPPGDPGPIR